jgi:urease accessory protein
VGRRGVNEHSQRIFAANRARGNIALTVHNSGGRTRPHTVQESGALRVRFPRSSLRELEAFLINVCGGVAGGDWLAVAVSVGANAGLLATTVAAEKVYRSLGPEAKIHLKAAQESVAASRRSSARAPAS